jgi:hypothetical protein
MSYFRSYFEKNNTIVKNSQVNTAKNPTTDIFYGKSFSKFIFKLDFTDLQNKIDNGDLVINNNTKHYLKMTNTIFGDETFLGAPRGNGKERTNSFDLILFKVPQFWDEGLGFDYEDEEFDFTVGNLTFDERPSNWYNRTTLNGWTTPGIYSTSPDVIQTIHFDNGNENINADITTYVNSIIVSGETNYGLGLAFSNDYQDFESEVDRSVAFFSKYTQTFFEPFVESVFDDRIEDDRNNFIEKLNQSLFLYVTKGASNFYDLDSLPTVDILDSNNTPITGLTNLTTTKIRKGVYKVSFGIDGIVCDGKKFFYDKWKNIEIDGVSLNDVTQKFIPKPYTSSLSIGSNPTNYDRYAIQFYGVKQNEKIKRGELRKIVVNFKSIQNKINILLDEVYYRIFIKEGKTEVTVHDWTLLDKTNENSFILDTSIYIPREYWVEIKAKINSDEIFYEEYIKFEIVSEK